MILAIVGSRYFENYEFIKGVLLPYLDKIDMIVSGGAKGVDTLAYRFAVEYGITFVCHPPNPREPSPQRYHRRNVRIANHAEVCIAFPDSGSKGTYHTISKFRQLGKKVVVVEV